MIIPNKSIRHLLLFLVATAALLGTASAITSIKPKIVGNIPFSRIPVDSILITNSMTESQQSDVKFSYALAAPPPDIGLFGNHLIRYLGNTGLPENVRNKTLFNYYNEHFTLEDTRELLLFAERHNALPTELIIIGVNNPYWQRREMLGYRGNLPDWIFHSLDSNSQRTINEKIRRGWYSLLYTTQERTAWRNIAYVFSTAVLETSFGNLLARLGIQSLMRKWFDRRQYTYANKNSKFSGYQRDGSFHLSLTADKKSERFPVDSLRKKNTDKISPLYQPADIGKISSIMREIEAIAKRNGRAIAFAILPAMLPYKKSDIDQKYFSDMLARLKDLTIFDDRWENKDKTLFFDHRHPGANYLKFVITRLTKKRESRS